MRRDSRSSLRSYYHRKNVARYERTIAQTPVFRFAFGIAAGFLFFLLLPLVLILASSVSVLVGVDLPTIAPVLFA